MEEKVRVYLEASFWRRLDDRASPLRRRISRRFLDQGRRHFVFLSSVLTMQEIQRAHPPEEARAARRRHLEVGPELVAGGIWVHKIAEELMDRGRGAWGRKVVADLTHMAYAIRGRARAVVTWNLTHMSSVAARKVMQLYCRDHGIEQVLLGNPEEVLRWYAEAIL